MPAEGCDTNNILDTGYKRVCFRVLLVQTQVKEGGNASSVHTTCVYIVGGSIVTSWGEGPPSTRESAWPKRTPPCYRSRVLWPRACTCVRRLSFCGLSAVVLTRVVGALEHDACRLRCGSVFVVRSQSAFHGVVGEARALLFRSPPNGAHVVSDIITCSVADAVGPRAPQIFEQQLSI